MADRVRGDTVRIVFLDDAMYSLDGDVDFSGISSQGDYVHYANLSLIHI